MSKNKAPAFPTIINHEVLRGMTLRDYFAAAVLPTVYEELNDAEGIFKRSDIAEHAYLMADAMLHFRDQT
jgi:hypothetical protein